MLRKAFLVAGGDTPCDSFTPLFVPVELLTTAWLLCCGGSIGDGGGTSDSGRGIGGSDVDQ